MGFTWVFMGINMFLEFYRLKKMVVNYYFNG